MLASINLHSFQNIEAEYVLPTEHYMNKFFPTILYMTIFFLRPFLFSSFANILDTQFN